jgi:hypothetical protein
MLADFVSATDFVDGLWAFSETFCGSPKDFDSSSGYIASNGWTINE